MSTLIDARFGSLAEGLAAVDTAVKQQGSEAALEILTALREEFPEQRAPFSRACALLQQAGRVDELDQWLAEARARFPGDLGVAFEYARSAQRRRDFDEGGRRWQSVCAEFPDEPVAYVGLVTALREAEQFDAADDAAAAALARFPDAFELLVAHAFVAQMRRDWAEAARRWEAARVCQPEHHIGWVLGGRSLRECGQADLADALLRPAIERFPDLPLPLVEFAWVAHGKRDWTTALERWETVRERFPDELAGYIIAAQALRELQRLDEADALLGAAIPRFPNVPGLLMDYAGTASIRRDWPEAVRRWAIVRERYPNEPSGWQMGAAALRESGQREEAEALLAEALIHFPDHEATLAEYASIAQARSDWPTAVRRWEELRRAVPRSLRGYTAAAHALRQAGFPKEAEALLELATERFPDDAGPLINAAWMATHRNDMPVAIDRWNRLLARLPDDPTGYHGMAYTLRAAQRLDEAEAFLQQATLRFPDAAVLACEYAWIASARGDRDAALERWQFVRDRFPRYSTGYVGLSRTLHERGEPDLAEQVVEAGIKDIPGDGACLIEYAELANRQRNWSTAADRWATVRARFPHVLQGFTNAAAALRELRQFEAAEALLTDAMLRFPAEARPWLEHAAVATARADWDVSLERLKEARRRFPGDAGIQKALHDAQLRVGTEDADFVHHEPPEEGSAQAAGANDEMREIVSAFASLGGEMRGCEFGEVQRLHNAEPLDLLRWTHSPPAGLIAALESRFEGIGLPEQTEVFVHRLGNEDQYEVRDRRFGLGTHTLIKAEEAPQEKVVAQTCRRLQYLRGKLINDLESANKIFVYRTAVRNLDDTELDRLHAAIYDYNGDTTLLYVRYADPSHPDGTVEVARPGLLIGYLDRFGAEPSGALVPIPFGSWVVVCREAYRLWQSGATRGVSDAPDDEAIVTSIEPADPTFDDASYVVEDASYVVEDASYVVEEEPLVEEDPLVEEEPPVQEEPAPMPEIVAQPPPQPMSQGGWRQIVRSVFRR
jgi:tetratricopeptide (TPR) repeat protein